MHRVIPAQRNANANTNACNESAREKRSYYVRAEGCEPVHLFATQPQQAVYEYAMSLAFCESLATGDKGKYIGQVYCTNGVDKTTIYDAACYVDRTNKKLSGSVKRARTQRIPERGEDIPLRIYPPLTVRESLLAAQYTLLGIPASIKPAGQCVQYASGVKVSLASTARKEISVYLTWSELIEVNRKGGNIDSL